MARLDRTDLPRGLLTFMFTDIEGSTRIVLSLGDRYPDVHLAHQQIVRGAIRASGGIEVSTEGDSFFAVFRSASDGATAAAAIHLGLAAQPWPSGWEVRVRIGLHSGQAIPAGEDYLGIDVHRAARIADAGHGGQTVLSEETARLLAGQLPAGLRLEDLGRHRLKDVGVEHVWTLVGDGLLDDFGPLRSLEAHPTNLPAALVPLVDREAEVRVVAESLERAPLVTLTGPAGVGKSRVALEAARSLVARFVDGVFFVDLGAIETADVAAVELARSVGIALPATSPGADLINQLRDRDALLLLDTADRVRDLADLAVAITADCPRIRLLVTSRSPLRLSSEREVPIGPLPVPERPASVDRAAAEASPAVALFAARAAAVRPGFEVTEDNAPILADIVTQLDGMPLAIELAAARIRLLSLEALAGRLSNRLMSLAGGNRDAPARQRTLRDAIAWSYELLSASEQTLLARLSVFAGSFDLEGAEAIGGGSGPGGPVAGGELDEALDGLVEHSLVSRVDDPARPRFRLLGAIREFALEALGAKGLEPSAREDHARFWLSHATRASTDLEGAREGEALRSLESGMDDYRSIVEWATTAGVTPTADGTIAPPELALDLVGQLGRFLWLRSHVREGEQWLERILALTPDAPPELRARAMYWSGVLLDELRRPVEAADRLVAALEIQRSRGDRRGVARTLNSLGVVARSQGDLDRAESLLMESLELKRVLGDERGIASSLSNLGIVAADRSRFDAAVDRFAEALELDEAAGSEGVVAYSRLNLGGTLVRAGRIAEGVVLVERALPVLTELGDADSVAAAYDELGEAALRSSAIDRAARLILAADAIRQRESLPLRTLDRTRIDGLIKEVEAAIPSDEIDVIRAEAGAIDLESAVAYNESIRDL